MVKVVFDIETVRGFKSWDDCPDDVKAAWEYVASRKFPDMEPGEAYEEKAGLFPEFGKIVVISAVDNREKKVMSFAAEKEGDLLKEFAEAIEKWGWDVQLIGHYIKGFDLPYVWTRMVANGIKLPRPLRLYGTKPWEMNMIDTREVWKQGLYTTCQASSLVAVCLAMGVDSPKDGDVSGGSVSEVYYSDDENGLGKIVKYCEADVMATAQVFNNMVKYGMV